METQVYEIILDVDVPDAVELLQIEFMGAVFAAAKKANITGQGLNIVLRPKEDR